MQFELFSIPLDCINLQKSKQKSEAKITTETCLLHKIRLQWAIGSVTTDSFHFSSSTLNGLARDDMSCHLVLLSSDSSVWNVCAHFIRIDTEKSHKTLS